MKRITRQQFVTDDEAAKDQQIRDQVANDFPPSAVLSISPDITYADGATVEVKCSCGFCLEVPKIHLEEISAGVWGTIQCPACGTRLNDKISISLLGEPAVTHMSG